ncbi:flagellar protein FlaG [Cupriavidus sp. NPDC089707]|uniref:flagellar protein FlaG n=1 Tax=Cupriavidus sp. NPDC089707 TaxID=3363963 RepID=UPI0038225EDE
MPPSPIVNPGTVRVPSDMQSANAAAAHRAPPPAGVTGAGGDTARPINDSTASGDAQAALGELADALKTTSIGLRFEIDEDTNRIITKVIDKETGDLIRQMPTEEVLRIARAMDKLQGLLVSQTA